MLSRNPTLHAKRPRQPGTQPGHIWDAKQLAQFLEYADQHRLGAFFRLAAATGARRGELLFLRWSNVHALDNPAWVEISGAVSKAAGQRNEGPTKTGRSRKVSVDATTAQSLLRHRAAQERDRSIAGSSWVEGDYVFRMQIGAPIYPDTPTALMAQLIRQYNQEHPRQTLPVIRLHDLRHLHATLLLKAGVPVHVVSQRLGHADPAMTLRVYAHVLGVQADQVATVYGGLLDSQTGVIS